MCVCVQKIITLTSHLSSGPLTDGLKGWQSNLDRRLVIELWRAREGEIMQFQFANAFLCKANLNLLLCLNKQSTLQIGIDGLPLSSLVIFSVTL